MSVKNLKQSFADSIRQIENDLTQIREKITHIGEELHWLENAPLCLDDALIQIDHFFEKNQGIEGIQQFFYAKERMVPNLFKTKVDFDRTADRDGSLHIISGLVDLSSILISILGPTLKRNLYDMATKQAVDIESGPPLTERATLKKELLKTKYALEVEEENLISTAEELGIYTFYRREDCNPKIVLMTEEAA